MNFYGKKKYKIELDTCVSMIKKLEKLLKEKTSSYESIKVQYEVSIKAEERETRGRKEIEEKYRKLKSEAIDYHKEIILESSLKIIGAVLKNKKPDNSWINQQKAAQQQLSSLQSGLSYSGSPVGGLVRSLGL